MTVGGGENGFAHQHQQAQQPQYHDGQLQHQQENEGYFTSAVSVQHKVKMAIKLHTNIFSKPWRNKSLGWTHSPGVISIDGF